jgi:hypothetical protein
MPLLSPILDDRTYDQLVTELVGRIPVYNPEWTDHNDSDPAITLLQLFAFQAENLLYRFNQIPEATYIEYLRLLQVPLTAASPSRALLVLTTDKPEGVAVPPRSLARAGKTPFQTLDEVTVWPVSGLAAVRAQSEAPAEADEPEVYEYVLRTLDALPPAMAEQPRIYYETKLPNPADPLSILDFAEAVDGMMWIAVLAEKGFDRTVWTDPLRPAALLNVGFEPDLPRGGIDSAAACPGLGAGASTPQVHWQISTPRPVVDGQPRYAALTVESDTTRGLSQGGVVRLRLPKSPDDIGLPVVDEDLAGAGDHPPRLDDERAAKLVCWLRVFRRDGARFGAFRSVVLNAATSENAQTAAPEYLGSGNGQPAQVFVLANHPVLPDSERAQLTVEVEEAGAWTPYRRVDDFLASDRGSRHVVLDPESGRLRFGDGQRGRMPQWGERVRARGYRYGGGGEGNAPAGAISKIDLPGVKVSNPLAAAGGEDAEALEAALLRIPGELRRRGRAVTAGDFRELAQATPGVSVGRAECLPRFHPPSRSTGAAGVVSVVVWPKADPRSPNAPLPDAGLLRAVCENLDAKRLVTTELYVIPPTYRRIAVSVSLQVKPGYGIEAIQRWVELVLRQYLAPLPPYGPAGEGWPLGRRVHGPELEAAALQVEGVDYLEGLAVAFWSEDQHRWIPGTVELAAYEVPEVTSVVVTAGLPLPAPGAGIDPSSDGKVPLPVPVLREVC